MSIPLLQEHPPPPPPITPLPPPTQSLLRSSTILPSLPSILSELTQNSIDAHSTRINCTVDLDTWTVKVEDNGEGFTREGIAQLAQKGGRYCTSKLSAGDATAAGTSADTLLSGVETYGFRGEALASIVDVATLEIRSTSARTGETSEVVLRGGEVVRLVTIAGGGAGGGKGTTVWARDIFYKLPVRRRPLLRPSTHATLLSQLRSTLSTLSLIHPNIAFSLTDTTSSSGSGNGEAKVLLQLNRANEGVVGRWKQIWGRAGVEKVWEFDEVEVEREGQAEEGSKQNGEGGRIGAKGFFSLSAAHSKARQYVFVNSRPLSPTSSPLHKLLNSLIASSSFARHASSHLSYSPSPSKPTPSPARVPAATVAKTSRQSPKKAAERHPVFVVCLEVPGGWVDVSLEPEKRVVEFSDPKRIESFLSSLTKKFLVENGFATAPPPAPPPPSLPAQPTAEETPKKRSRGGEASTSTTGRKRVAFSLEEDSTPRSSSRPITRSTSTSRLLTRAVEPPIADPFSPSLSTTSATPAPPNGSIGYTRWTDPSTLHTYLIDPRTGNSWREGTRPDLELESHEMTGCEGCGGQKGTRRSRGMVERGWLKRSRDEGGEKEEMPEWLRGTLEDWHNPIFPSIPSSSIGAAKIPSLPALPVNNNNNTSLSAAVPTLSSAFSSSKAGLARSARKTSSSSFSSAAAPALTHSRLKTMTDFFSTSSYPAPSPHPAAEPASLLPLSASSSSGSHRLTRASLAEAEFVAQVDDKFLLIRVPPPSSSPFPSSARGVGTLVLVDQHAASERVRVERFWTALTRSSSEGGVERKLLEGEEERVGVVVGREEARVVKETEAEGEWGRWGIGFEDFELPEEGEAGAAEGGGDYVQLFLSSVPALLAARLTSEPRTAQELVRSFVAQLRERGTASGRGSRRRGGQGEGAGEGEDGGGTGSGWVAQVKDAPPVLVELVNSKACRGAVMFNDVLPPSQSLSLLRSLSATKFPFQCAHGRPSMVPLVELPAPSSSRGRGGGGGSGVDWEKFA